METYCYIWQRLLEVKLGGKYSSSKILDTLRNMNFLQLREGYIPTFDNNEVTKDIAEVFGYKYIERGCYM